MTKKEQIKMNKQATIEKLHATAEWQEAMQLEQECESAYKSGNLKTAKLLAGRCLRMKERARKSLKQE